jgi:hypothetical protein
MTAARVSGARADNGFYLNPAILTVPAFAVSVRDRDLSERAHDPPDPLLVNHVVFRRLDVQRRGASQAVEVRPKPPRGWSRLKARVGLDRP